MDITTINTDGARAAQAWLGCAVGFQADKAYPPQPARAFQARVEAVYPHGLVVRRAGGYCDFVSFVDLFTGHIRAVGHLGTKLARVWHPSWVLDEAAG